MSPTTNQWSDEELRILLLLYRTVRLDDLEDSTIVVARLWRKIFPNWTWTATSLDKLEGVATSDQLIDAALLWLEFKFRYRYWLEEATSELWKDIERPNLRRQDQYEEADHQKFKEAANAIWRACTDVVDGERLQRYCKQSKYFWRKYWPSQEAFVMRDCAANRQRVPPPDEYEELKKAVNNEGGAPKSRPRRAPGWVKETADEEAQMRAAKAASLEDEQFRQAIAASLQDRGDVGAAEIDGQKAAERRRAGQERNSEERALKAVEDFEKGEVIALLGKERFKSIAAMLVQVLSGPLFQPDGRADFGSTLRAVNRLLEDNGQDRFADEEMAHMAFKGAALFNLIEYEPRLSSLRDGVVIAIREPEEESDPHQAVANNDGQQEEAEQGLEIEDDSSPAPPPLTQDRLDLFQETLVDFIHGPVFGNDGRADFEPILATVNVRIGDGEQRFEDGEGHMALQALADAGNIQYAHGEYGFHDGVVSLIDRESPRQSVQRQAGTSPLDEVEMLGRVDDLLPTRSRASQEPKRTRPGLSAPLFESQAEDEEMEDDDDEAKRLSDLDFGSDATSDGSREVDTEMQDDA